jgi:hypothetical protein
MSNFNVFREQISDSESDTEITAENANITDEVKKYDAPYEKINDRVFIMRGKEKTKMNSERLVVYNNSKVSLFWGKCFMCGCVGHSQRFCPLKYCTKCQMYSHSVVTCSPNLKRRYRHYNYRRNKYSNKYVNHQRRVQRVVRKMEKETKAPRARITVAIPRISVRKHNGNTNNHPSSHADRGGEKIPAMPKKIV